MNTITTPHFLKRDLDTFFGEDAQRLLSYLENHLNMTDNIYKTDYNGSVSYLIEQEFDYFKKDLQNLEDLIEISVDQFLSPPFRKTLTTSQINFYENW